MNNYLIPANSKRSMLKFGLFRNIDLVIFIVGIVLTFILILFIMPPKNLVEVGLDLIPVTICTIMVVPIPNQMNIWAFTVNVYSFLVHQRNYKWRGWCKCYGKETDKQ